MDYYKKQKTFKNPIIPGFYPDPSICRVGDDYYLVNSSFEYFPAIPVWHSKDLVNWKQIGNAIDREEQMLNLDVGVSGGVQACTIRYNNGTFYIISTCIRKEWPRLDYNFIITAKDPAGPWSEVHYIQDAPGIDSSLFFDDDGKAYFHANRERQNGNGGGDTEIWVQEINLDTFELVGQKYSLWNGCGGNFPEGPHIYKRNSYYYLMIAEGGTCHWHTVTMARSTNLFGPYESIPRNPILTHKHLHRTYPIQNVGHADLVETQNGEWYMVCLGSRPKGGYYDGGNLIHSFGGYYRNMGRETFLVPMVWEDEFGPIVSPLTGKVEEEYPLPNLTSYPIPFESGCSHFESDQLELCFNTIRNQKMDFFSLKERKGYLRLKMQPTNITQDDNVSFLGRRQTSWTFSAATKIEVNLNEYEQVGLTTYLNYKAHTRLFIEKNLGTTYITLIRRFKGKDVLVVKEEVANTKCIYLKVDGDEQDYRFYYSVEPSKWCNIGGIVDGRNLACDISGGHTGAYIGIFATSNGKPSCNYADFDYFEYVNL
jgi:alpha-N-arabinofuranosidase